MFSLTSTFPRDKCQQLRQEKVKATNLYYLVSCYYNVRNEPDNPILFKYKRAVKNNRSVPRMRLFSRFYQPHIVCIIVYQAITSFETLDRQRQLQRCLAGEKFT
jgi:hypothetical protein